MIIQCDHCSAKFRIDDAKLANGAVKVRCAKCKEIFVVKGEEPPAETEQAPQTPAPAAFQDDSSASAGDFSFDQDLSFDAAPAAAPPTPTPAADEFDWKDTSINLDAPAPSPEFDVSAAPSDFDSSAFGAETVSAPAVQDKAAAGVDSDFDFGDISMAPPAAEGTAPAPAQDDFSIDFGEVSFAAPQAAESGGAFTAPPAGDFSFEETPAAEAPPAAAGDAGDDFMISFNTEETKQVAPASAPEDGGENVNFGDFSFGEMDDEPKADQTVVIKQPLPSVAKDAPPVAAPDPFLGGADEEMVPTSLPSRKKSGSRFPVFLIFGAIVIVLALAGAGVYFIGGAKAFSKAGLGFLVDWYGKKNTDEGSMSIRNSNSAYVINSGAGELFVVRGEAVNNFKKPRASVQVKVSILGTGGAVLASKTAFCGNSISNEQLASLPLAKIEEAMNNQFGDSLANLGVKPGSAIPFVVVLSAVPKEATDFSVQIVGSTVATQ